MSEVKQRKDPQLFFTPDKNSNTPNRDKTLSYSSFNYPERDLELRDLRDSISEKLHDQVLSPTASIDDGLSSLVNSFHVLSKQLKLRESEL